MPIKESKYHLHFPDFNGTDYSSADDGSSCEVELAAARKEDQDVAVFMAIAEMLSMESLLHLLQGQAHAALADIAGDGYKPTRKETRSKAPVKKRFRFAKDKRRRGVFCEIFEIESIKEMDLWWSDDESDEMRRRAVRTVKQTRQSTPEFTSSVETIVRAPLVENKSRRHTHQVETAMKYLIGMSFIVLLCNGLQSHRPLSLHRAFVPSGTRIPHCSFDGSDSIRSYSSSSRRTRDNHEDNLFVRTVFEEDFGCVYGILVAK